MKGNTDIDILKQKLNQMEINFKRASCNKQALFFLQKAKELRNRIKELENARNIQNR